MRNSIPCVRCALPEMIKLPDVPRLQAVGQRNTRDAFASHAHTDLQPRRARLRLRDERADVIPCSCARPGRVARLTLLYAPDISRGLVDGPQRQMFGERRSGFLSGQLRGPFDAGSRQTFDRNPDEWRRREQRQDNEEPHPPWESREWTSTNKHDFPGGQGPCRRSFAGTPVFLVRRPNEPATDRQNCIDDTHCVILRIEWTKRRTR